MSRAHRPHIGEIEAGVRRIIAQLDAMVIREPESPSARHGASNWPPRSAREVLLSSPRGQKRLERPAERTSISPSPVKRTRLSNDGIESPLASDQEEDEETLRLQLQAIETRLKLKKLQQSKQKAADGTRNTVPLTESSQRLNCPPPYNGEGTRAVAVPASPIHKRRHQQEMLSPERIRLGIDKGVKASEISVSRGSARGQGQGLSDKLRGSRATRMGGEESSTATSFSKRLAAARVTEDDRKSRIQQKLEKRSKGFGLSKQPQPSSTSFSAQTGSKAQGADAHEEEENLNDEDNENLAGRNHDTALYDNFSKLGLTRRILPSDMLDSALNDKTVMRIPHLLKVVTGPEYEPPDVDGDFVVVGIVASKSSPYNRAPTHRTTSDADPDEKIFGDRSKFMVLHLTDLKWEIDLFLFDTGFEKFWKLTVGTVIAILNPMIMPPKPHMRDTGRFSLKLGSSDDTVLEIGVAKDLGYCKSIKRDGNRCTQWINMAKTEFCEFHVNLKIDKARVGRMEVNTMTSLYSDYDKKGTKSKNRSFYGKQGKGRFKDDGLIKEGRQRDDYLKETYYLVPPGSGASTAKLFDEDEIVDRGMTKAERSRKRLAAKEKERELARQLGAKGEGMGAAYIRVKQSKTSTTHAPQSERERSSATREALDATSLGLVGSSASTARLSPTKSRKSAAWNDAGMGWSSAFRRGLPDTKREAAIDASQVTRSHATSKVSPTKKARFLIDAKVKIPGAETSSQKSRSVGAANDKAHDDDDDDELDII